MNLFSFALGSLLVCYFAGAFLPPEEIKYTSVPLPQTWKSWTWGSTRLCTLSCCNYFGINVLYVYIRRGLSKSLYRNGLPSFLPLWDFFNDFLHSIWGRLIHNDDPLFFLQKPFEFLGKDVSSEIEWRNVFKCCGYCFREFGWMSRGEDYLYSIRWAMWTW